MTTSLAARRICFLILGWIAVLTRSPHEPRA